MDQQLTTPEGIALSRRKYGGVPYYCLDVLQPRAELLRFDYVVMNGVFMSAHLGWELPHLFHVPVDRLAAVLAARLTRNFVVRADYGLPDYTVYIYR